MSGTFSLRGKRAVVTGGTRGVGGAVARLLAECGADVCVGYRNRTADADAMVATLAAAGVQGIAHAADLGDPAGARSLIDAAVTAFGGLDVVVHSAGIWPVEEVPVHEMSDDRWRRTMRENVDAMFFVSRAGAAAMSDGGRIVHVASTAGQRGEAMHADYAASKGAMIAFVKSQAVELASRGITVNCVAPGWVDTEMCAEPFAGGGRERIAAAIPVGRIAAPADIAFAVVSLCFDGAQHMTGEIVNVNGGAVLCG